MSSATRFDPGGVKKMLGGIAEKLFSTGRVESVAEAMKRIGRLGMSGRQQELNHLWGWYRGDHYAARRTDWNGKEVLDPIEHESIATAGFLPPGYYDAGSNLPIKFRRPSAPYGLARVIVDRFTSILFSERHHPQLRIEGDEDSDGYVDALIKECRLWSQMILARTYGGAMGSVAVGFQFVDGKPVIEVHDPRWLFPVFADRSTLRLKSLEKRYMFVVEELDPTGQYADVWYWYRRVIDADRDTVYLPAPVGDGEEPQWEADREVVHSLGFCPVVWTQNSPLQDDCDGDPDCHGTYDSIETIDALVAQANKGILQNCDPTVIIATDAKMESIRKGSDDAIKLPAGGSAQYMEISGRGPEAAMKQASELRRQVLETTRCVLDFSPAGGSAAMTATEVERLFSAMLARADELREQYGQKLILPLVEMMVAAARQLGEGTLNAETGAIEKQVLVLSPKAVLDDEGNVIGRQPHKLGQGGSADLQWPRYFVPTLADVEQATRAAGAAKAAGLIDDEHAIQFVSEFYRVDDVRGMMRKLEKDQGGRQQDAASDMLARMKSSGQASE